MPHRLFSEDEYLLIERGSASKSEYFDGEIFAMAGAGRAHTLIATNISGLLYNQFRGRPCEHHVSDLRVRVAEGSLYAYPDIVALCGEAKMHDGNGDILLNPQLIVEILSPSTASFDKGEKGNRYRQLDSLADLLFVEQSRVFVQHWRRTGEQTWIATEYDQLTDRVLIEGLSIELSLAEIYERVHFPPPSPNFRIVP